MRAFRLYRRVLFDEVTHLDMQALCVIRMYQDRFHDDVAPIEYGFAAPIYSC